MGGDHLTSSGDQALKRMRDPDLWTAVMEACPLHAHWLQGEPIGDLEAMGGVIDRYRRPMPTGGLCSPASRCWATPGRARTPRSVAGYRSGWCTRSALREVVRSHWRIHWSSPSVGCGYRGEADSLVSGDGRRGSRPAARNRRAAQRVGAAAAERPFAILRGALLTAMLHDPDLFRAFLASRSFLTPLSETFAQDGCPSASSSWRASTSACCFRALTARTC